MIAYLWNLPDNLGRRTIIGSDFVESGARRRIIHQDAIFEDKLEGIIWILYYNANKQQSDRRGFGKPCHY